MDRGVVKKKQIWLNFRREVDSIFIPRGIWATMRNKNGINSSMPILFFFTTPAWNRNSFVSKHFVPSEAYNSVLTEGDYLLLL
ncbi:hypothetical protein THIOM_004249 [Candidatus Thiomargarita nelsonii]|uniref:Uncharacterized protein n=1 Tax=Candidatus Thiomargarita nelsonii TaxID=1003181 RepID=A0A0A6RKZ9_9GAMM|nr:hypothetical protein THIOM_004249 [Candidatus Thiomargarita nelsonii]